MKHLNFLLLIMMLGLTSLIYAQGETCATAVAVTPGMYNADGPSTGAGYLNACLPGTGNADWYSFTPTVDGQISIIPATPADAAIDLFSGTCAALVCVNSADNAALLNETVVANTTYFIQFGAFYNTIAFDWTFEFVPVNDSCATPTNLIVEPSGTQTNFTEGSTVWASSSPLALNPSCMYNNFGNDTVYDVFYNFTMPAGATDLDIIVTAITGGGNDYLQFAVWDACGGTELFCNNLINITGTTNVTGLTAGSSYILQVLSAESELADFEIGLEAGTAVVCNAGDVSAALNGATINYCDGDIISLDTDGTESLFGSQVYAWFFADTTDLNNQFAVNSTNGTSFSGDLTIVNSTQGQGPLPIGTYYVVGSATDGSQTNTCATTNQAILNVLAPNDPLCNQTNCEVGDLASTLVNTTITICSDGVITLQTDGNEVIPAGESYVWIFQDQNSTFQTGLATSSNYTGSINTDFGAGNELPAGTYTVFGALTDSSLTVICGNVNTSSSLTLVILPANDPMCAPSCDISSLTAGTQTTCDPATNNYTQQVVVNYSNAPSTGMLAVNGQTFPIATSPQTVTLTGLDSDGAAVSVTASFTDETACFMTQNNLFVAPSACGSVGINDLNINALQIYPNPSKGTFNVAFDLDASKDINIKVMSILGKQLYYYQASNVSGSFNHRIDLKDLNAGVYLVVINDGKQHSTHKVVIQD